MRSSTPRDVAKPSWADALPSHWGWTSLNAACAAIVDCPHSTPKVIETSDFLMARTQDIQTGIFRKEEAARVSEDTYRTRTKRARPASGDLLYSREGTYFGVAAEVPENCKVCLGQRMVLLRPESDILTTYLRYWLNSPQMQAYIHGFRAGSVAERLNLRAIRRLPVATPPRREQEAIAETLSALDDKIELNRKMNRTLEEIAQTLFRAWFVDFEGETDLVESEVGLIPRGWEVKPLPEVFEVNPKRKLARGTEAPYLEMKNMPTQGARALDWYDREFKGSGTRFVNGDVLVARITPCLENGKTAFVDFLGDGELGWGSTEYLVLRSKPPLPAEYAYFFARTSEFRQFAISNMTGTSGRQRVRANALDHYLIPVPPRTAVEKFGEFAALVLKALKARDKESRTLAEIRDTLLPKLISGEIRVPGAEEVVEEAV